MIVEVVWIILSLICSFIINYVYAKINHKKCNISSYLTIFAVLVIYGFLAMQAGNVVSGQVELIM